MPWLLAQRTDREVCMQSTMKLSVVKVAPGGPAWLLGWGWGLRAWPGAHPFRERGVLVLRAGNGESVEDLWGCPPGTRMCNDLLDLSYRNI